MGGLNRAVKIQGIISALTLVITAVVIIIGIITVCLKIASVKQNYTNLLRRVDVLEGRIK